MSMKKPGPQNLQDRAIFLKKPGPQNLQDRAIFLKIPDGLPI